MHALDITPSIGPPGSRVWLARQPILDRRGATYAYEILFRSGPENRAIIEDGSRAAAQTILSAFGEIDVMALCGRARAFFNVTADVLHSPGVEALPKSRVVLEILETVKVDLPLLARVRELTAMGFRVAIDDFGQRSELWSLVEYVDLVKVDVLPLSDEELVDTATRLKRTGVKILAEKVETRQMHARCIELGFDYFQGYFFQIPEILTGRRLPQARVETMRLLTMVRDEATPLSDLEQMISSNATLSYRLLRTLSSAAYRRGYEIDSVHRAMVMLGRERLGRWVTLLALAGLDDQPSELLATALLRARMCEVIAEREGRHDAGTYYAAGLFSLLDVMMRRPMPTLLETLPIAPALQDALARRAGHIGEVLSAVTDYEQGEWRGLDVSVVPPEELADIYFDSVRWSAERMAELGLG